MQTEPRKTASGVESPAAVQPSPGKSRCGKSACGCGSSAAPQASRAPVAAHSPASTSELIAALSPGEGAAPTPPPAERRATDGEATPAVPGQGPNRRLSGVDRRTGMDRRRVSAEDSGYTGPERRTGVERRDTTGLERRRGPGRRRSDDRKAAEEGEMNVEQFEFIMAIETYKKVNKKLYPTWTEILEVVRQLGYRKIKPREIKLENVPEPRLVSAA